MKKVGILGGGQLGLLLAQSLARLGSQAIVYDPDSDAPACHQTSRVYNSGWLDRESLERFFDNLKTTISFSKLDLKVRPDLKNEYLKLKNEFLVNHKNFLKLNDYINKFDKRSLPFTYPRLKKKKK